MIRLSTLNSDTRPPLSRVLLRRDAEEELSVPDAAQAHLLSRFEVLIRHEPVRIVVRASLAPAELGRKVVWRNVGGETPRNGSGAAKERQARKPGGGEDVHFHECRTRECEGERGRSGEGDGHKERESGERCTRSLQELTRYPSERRVVPVARATGSLV